MLACERLNSASMAKIRLVVVGEYPCMFEAVLFFQPLELLAYATNVTTDANERISILAYRARVQSQIMSFRSFSTENSTKPICRFSLEITSAFFSSKFRSTLSILILQDILLLERLDADKLKSSPCSL